MSVDTKRSQERYDEDGQSENQAAVKGEKDVDSIKQQIARISADLKSRGLVQEQADRFCQELASGQAELPPDQLKQHYDYIVQLGSKCDKIVRRLEKAVREKALSKEDTKFLIEKIVQDPDFSNSFSAAEKAVEDSLKKRKKERDSFFNISNSPLVKDGKLKISDTKEINVPDETSWLKLKVPERRKLLKELEDTMPKAEKYSKDIESKEGDEKEKRYSGMLEEANTIGISGKAENGFLGREAVNKFKEWFKGLKNNEEKENAIKAFPAEMDRYISLNKDIKSVLKGESLSEMKQKSKDLGYSKLREAFMVKMDKEYADKLKDEPISDKHTRPAFKKYMEECRDYDRKIYIFREFDKQMQPYRSLKKEIEGMEDKPGRKKLLKMYNENNGYTEIKQEYDKLNGVTYKTEEEKKKAHDPLSAISNPIVKGGIGANLAILKELGGVQAQRNFLSFMKRTVTSKDTGDFRSNISVIRKKAKQRDEYKKQLKEEKAKQSANTGKVLFMQDRIKRKRGDTEAEAAQKEKEEQNRQEEKNAKTVTQIENQIKGKKDLKTIEEKVELEGRLNTLGHEKREIKETRIGGFTEVEAQEERGTEKVIMNVINCRAGLKGLFAKDAGGQYRSHDLGGNTEAKFAVGSFDGRTVQLDNFEANILMKALEQDIKEQERKAA